MLWVEVFFIFSDEGFAMELSSRNNPALFVVLQTFSVLEEQVILTGTVHLVFEPTGIEFFTDEKTCNASFSE